MSISEAELKEVEQFSYSMMSISEIALILEVDLDSFAREVFNVESHISKAVNRGQLRAKADVRKAIITAAASGSTPAIKDALELIKKYQLDIELNYEAARYSS